MKGKLLKTFASSAVALSMLVGCSSGSGTAGTELKEGDTVKIGLNYELSGAVASYGQAEYKGATLAIKEYNANKDSKYKIKAVKMDNKGDASEATSAATKLMTEDGVAFEVGPATSGASIATYPVADQNQVPVISPSATQVDATMNGDSPYEYAFRICFEDSYQGKAMAKFGYENLGKRKAVIINEVSDYGKGLTKVFTQKFEDLGGEVVATESYNAKDTDFAGIITKVKDKGADVLFIAGYYSEAGLIIKQAREAGMDCTILGADGFESEKLAELAGKENLNNCYYSTAYTTVNASDDLTAFVDAYTEEYGEAPNMFSALTYDATNLGLQALEKAGKTGADLQKAIADAKFEGLTGSFTFDKTHSPKKSVLVVNLVDGVQTEAVSVDPNK